MSAPIIITLMTNLAMFTMANRDSTVCFEANNTATLEMVNHSDGDRITYMIGIDLNPVQFICRPRNWPRYFASVLACGEVPYNDSSVNVAEKQCGANCHSYVITPIHVDCILLKCERENFTSMEECRVYININESSSTVQSTAESFRTESHLQTANDKYDTSTVVAICAIVVIIVMVVVTGLVIYLCYKGSHRKRKPPDIDGTPAGQRDTDDHVDIVKSNTGQSADAANDETATSSDCAGSVKVVASDYNKVSSPQESDVTDVNLIFSTRAQRIEPHNKTQRGYELEIHHKEYEADTMKRSVKPTTIILGDHDANERPARLEWNRDSCQETDGNCNAYCFSSNIGVKYHPSGNGTPIVKTVLQEEEVKNYQWV